MGEVKELYCRFALPRRGPPPVADWASFAVALCGQFGLRLGANGAGPGDEAEFIAAVQSDRNYQEIAAFRGW